MPKGKIPRKNIRKMRKMRKSRVPRSLGADKVYTWNFRPTSQYLWNTGTPNSQAAPTPSTLTLQPNAAQNVLQGNNFPQVGVLTSVGSYPSSAQLAGYADTAMTLSFNLTTQLNQIAKFFSTFDQYKLNYVKVNVSYGANSASINGVGILPTIYAIEDIDGMPLPGTSANLRGKAGVKTWKVGNGSRTSFSLTVRPRPKVVAEIITGATAAALVPKRNEWMDCQQGNVDYNGLAMYFQNIYTPTGTAGITVIQFDFTFNVSFKGSQNLF